MTNISHKWSCLHVTSISSTSLNSFHGEICVFLNHVKVTQCDRHGYNKVNGFNVTLPSSWESYMPKLLLLKIKRLLLVFYSVCTNPANVILDGWKGDLLLFHFSTFLLLYIECSSLAVKWWDKSHNRTMDEQKVACNMVALKLHPIQASAPFAGPVPLEWLPRLHNGPRCALWRPSAFRVASSAAQWELARIVQLRKPL